MIEKGSNVGNRSLARKHNFLVISDFAYADICYDGYVAPSFLVYTGCSWMSRCRNDFHEQKLQHGWLAYRLLLRQQGNGAGPCNHQAITTMVFFAPIQIAAIVAMRHCDAAVESIAVEYQGLCDVLCDGLTRLGWNVTPPRAGMFVWAEIPEPWKKMGSIDFAMKLLNEGGVAVSPGRGFGPEGEGAVCDWPSWKTPQRLRQAVRQIDKCLSVTPEAASA